MDSPNIFWIVILLLLISGSIYYAVNALYLRWLDERTRQQGILYELAEKVMASTDPSTVLRSICDVSPLIARATDASVWIFDPESQQLVREVGTSAETMPAVSLNEMSGVVTCYRNRLMTDVPDAEHCPFVSRETVRLFGQKALLYLPIALEGECLGVIEVEDRRRKRLFSKDQKNRLEHIAKLAALSLRQRVQDTLDEELHRSEKMSALNELVQGLRQDLDQPLRKVVVMSTADDDEDEPPSTASRRLQLVNAEARRAARTLNRTLKLIQASDDNPEDIDIAGAVEVVVNKSMQRWKRKGLDLTLKLSRTGVIIEGNAERIRELLSDIFRHAETLLEIRGLRTLEVYSNVLDRSVLISMTPSLRRVADAVDELGSVVDDNDADEPAPLGLAVCQILVEQSGGTMRVDTGGSRGFSIEIEYPLARVVTDQGDSAQRREVAVQSPGKSLMTLVIDSDTGAQEELVFFMAAKGHRAIPVSSVEEGQDLSERVRFDWVFCNIQMGRTNGLDVYRSFQGRMRKFIFLADPSMVVYNQELFSGGDRAFLRKPIKPSELDRLF